MLRVYKGRFFSGVYYFGLVRIYGLRCLGIFGVYAVGAGYIWIIRFKMVIIFLVIRDYISIIIDWVVY